MNAGVVVVGTANRDAVARVERLPVQGETVLATEFGWFPGGKGANQAVAAARHGARVALVARVGDDENGRVLRDGLRDNGVDTTHVMVTPGVVTGVALINVDAAGANTIVAAGLANLHLTPTDVDAAAAVIEAAGAVVTQLETPMETVARALQLARAAGAVTVLNAAPARRVDDAVLDLVDVVVANELEAAMVPRTGRVVVETRGERGVVVHDRRGTTGYPSVAVEAVDATGAGDAFCGALVAALARGATVHDAIPAALEAGADAVTRRGAQ